MIQKSILSVPYNGDMNGFAFDLGGDAYLNDEDGVSIFSCLPGIIDPDTGNDWYKTLETWDEDNLWKVICPTCRKPWWLYGDQDPSECCTCE